jgi:glycosyltransferase involved in cell wall biosynthesis
VNRDIPDYAVAAGVPARVIKKRRPGRVASSGQSVKSPAQSVHFKKAPTRLAHSKRILYLSMYDPHVPYTGAGARGAQFVNFLARHFNLDLVYMTGSGHPGNPALEARFKERLRGVGEKIAVPFSRRGYFLYSKPLIRAATGLLLEKRYDWILCDYGLAGRYGIKLSERFGIPFAYLSHNIEFRQYLGKANSDPRRWPLVPYVRAFEKRAVRKCSLLVAISDEDAAFFSRWTSPDKMVVVPQGFDPSVCHPFYRAVKNRPRVVLFIGNYAISTNREAVRAVRDRIADAVLREIPGVVFRFVGANPPVDLGHPRFQFPGFVDSVADEIRRADVVISPILKGWGMPTKVVESLACGKPVIATEAGARSIPLRFERLRVCSLDRFAGEIVRTLRENRPVATRDLEALKNEYSWEIRIGRLVQAINAFSGRERP